MLTDKKMLKDISDFGSCNPYYELSYPSGSVCVFLSIKDYEDFNYSVLYKAESVKEAQEIYDEGIKWLTRVNKEIKMDDIGKQMFPILNGCLPRRIYT